MQYDGPAAMFDSCDNTKLKINLMSTRREMM